MSVAAALRADRGDDAGSQTLSIAVVNNMPIPARRATVAQFEGLLGAAASEHSVIIRFCHGPANGDRASLAELEALLDDGCDGLIVTGAEPRAARLPEDPIWPVVGRLVDWAEESGTPTIWSCLAAHAAVFHLDRIDRTPLRQKISGVFRSEVLLRHHAMLVDVNAEWQMPHSRHNTLNEDQLRRCGYDILVRSDEVGVDLFEKRGRAHFLFLQSHPEYGAGTLLREFDRDQKRFERGESAKAPAPPLNCTDEAVWRRAAIVLYRNWFRALADRKLRRAHSGAALPGSASPLNAALAEQLSC